MWFVSYVKNLADVRDSERKSDLSQVSSALKSYKQKRWSYPIPWDYFAITNNWFITAYQWKLNSSVTLSTLDSLPFDPYIDMPYVYSVTKNKQEFQLAATLENQEEYKAILFWNYKSVSKNVLPTIVLAVVPTWDMEIHEAVWDGDDNRKTFVFDNWFHNLPYTLTSPFTAYSDWTSFSWILNDEDIKYWQNSDYRTCDEIYTAWKAISIGVSEEYQILNSSWTLTNTWCVF